MQPDSSLISGFYDPCRDANNFEADVEFSGTPVQQYRNIPNAAECCRKCVAYKGCAFWTLVTSGVKADLCWLTTEASARVGRTGRVSGAFVARKRPS
jgi:hypothetical protein